jgi:hypothetical protein
MLRLWRVFPWDPAAPDGQPFSPGFITPEQVDGRYDLGGQPLVLNLAESPAHAVAEQIQECHGQRLEDSDLSENGRPLAVVEVTVAIGPHSLADLCDPLELSRYHCRPDELMSRDVACTQSISRRLHEFGLTGFRVWSALKGDWHCTILFMDRMSNEALAFGEPAMLTLEHPAVVEAARALDIRLSSPAK